MSRTQCAYALCADSCYSSPAAGCQVNSFFSYSLISFGPFTVLFLLYFGCCSICCYYLISTRVRTRWTRQQNKIVVYFLFSVSVFKYFRCRGRCQVGWAERERWSRQCEAEGRRAAARVACLVALTGSIINQLLWARKLAKWKLNTQMCRACDCEWIPIWIWIARQANGPTVMPPAPWAAAWPRLRLHFDRSLQASQRQRIVGRSKHRCCCYGCCNYWFLVG